MRPGEPRKGDRVDVPVLIGYRLEQERPFACRWTCRCFGPATCHGLTVHYPGTVSELIYWADNSREARVLCDDGRTRTLHLAPPSGDVCF